MKEFLIRSISGLCYVVLLILSLQFEYVFVILFYLFGLICVSEFRKLVQLKGAIPVAIYTILYTIFTASYHEWFPPWEMQNQITQILLVFTIFVQLFLIKDLFSGRKTPVFYKKQLIPVAFYVSTGFIFMLLIPIYTGHYNAMILLGVFILIWVNDSFAYLVGKNFGRQKLFEKISPKKTVEGFLGGLFFACIASYFVALFMAGLHFTNWLILAVIVSVFGTLGDLIESKFKRQGQVKDSGTIMPGHGGLLDRLDSIIFAAPIIYLFLKMTTYVS